MLRALLHNLSRTFTVFGVDSAPFLSVLISTRTTRISSRGDAGWRPFWLYCFDSLLSFSGFVLRFLPATSMSDQASVIAVVFVQGTFSLPLLSSFRTVRPSINGQTREEKKVCSQRSPKNGDMTSLSAYESSLWRVALPKRSNPFLQCGK